MYAPLRTLVCVALLLACWAGMASGARAAQAPAAQPLAVLNLLSPIPAEVDEEVAQAALNDPLYMEGKSTIPMEEMSGVWSRAFARAGLDYNASILQALQGADTEAYRQLLHSGGLPYVIPVLNGIKAGKCEYMVAQGWVSEQTAAEVLRFGTAMGFVTDNDEVSETAGTSPARDRHAAGRYCGTVNTFSSQGENVTQVWFNDVQGGYMGEFFFDSSEESCLSLMQEGQVVCFDYLGSEGGMHWIAGCN